MALKTLGQARPSSGVTGTLYQVGAGKAAVVANIIICNTDAANTDDFILYQVLAAGSPTVNNAIFKGTIAPGDSFVAVVGISLDQGESLRYYSANGRMTFTCSGDES